MLYMVNINGKINLSASALNLYFDCPRCFWLEQNGIAKRPEGIRASLPNGIDAVLKRYFDKYRGTLPPELHGRVEGRLVADQALLDSWRDRRRGLSYEDAELSASLKGLLDDCVVAGERYAPLDYKTKGFERGVPRDGDIPWWNQHQLNIYTLLLESNGYPTADCGYLIFYHPVAVHEGGLIRFEITPRKVPTSREAAKQLLADSVRLIRGPVPPHHRACEFCTWGANTAQV